MMLLSCIHNGFEDGISDVLFILVHTDCSFFSHCSISLFKFYFKLKILGSDNLWGRPPANGCTCLTVNLRHQMIHVSLYVGSVVPTDLFFSVLNVSFFCNSLSLIGCWPFSVALLQFEVYLWLILAIKCFALPWLSCWEFVCNGSAF